MPSPQPHRAGPLHQRLRLATSAAHRRLEQRMPITSPGFDLAAYRDLLAAFWGYYQPLEDLLSTRAPVIPGLDWPDRLKVPLLARDLHALGLADAHLARLPTCTHLPPLDHPTHLLGCLYVLEGSTLGGQVVQRLLVDRFGDAVEGALAFFRSYGPDVGRRWRSFLACLETVRAGRDAHEAERAALQTFATLEAWLEQREVLR